VCVREPCGTPSARDAFVCSVRGVSRRAGKPQAIVSNRFAVSSWRGRCRYPLATRVAAKKHRRRKERFDEGRHSLCLFELLCGNLLFEIANGVVWHPAECQERGV